MQALPDTVANMLDEMSQTTQKIAEYLIQRLPRGPYILVGRGQHYATCLEGALKVILCVKSCWATSVTSTTGLLLR